VECQPTVRLTLSWEWIVRFEIPRTGIIVAIIIAVIGGAAQGLMPYVVAWFLGSAATSGPVNAAPPPPVTHICDTAKPLRVLDKAPRKAPKTRNKPRC
jgi:hypothetical protein